MLLFFVIALLSGTTCTSPVYLVNDTVSALLPVCAAPAGDDLFADFGDPVGGSQGWDAHTHLRQQPTGMRTSLRTSADILGALRSSHVTEAAILSSNASRIHILHDAGELHRLWR